jgi:peptidoglycan/xylan/chitin deacetylase (PgdA/CDA1 family)
MIRTWIKTGAADVLCRCGLDRVAGALMGARNAPVVIGYHRVVEDFASSAQTAIPSLLISLRMLERHLDWIGRRYQFVDLHELGARLEREDSGDPIAAITFDDGYRDFYTHALPLLQRKGIPAAVFVVTDHVGTKRIQVHDKLYLLLTRRRGRSLPRMYKGVNLPDLSSMNPYQVMRSLLETLPLEVVEQIVNILEAEDSIPDSVWEPSYSVTWEMLERMQKAGAIVGSHTKTHPLMANETAARMQEEAAGSRAEIEARLGTVVEHFAYPSGVFNAASVNAVAAAGYRFAYTTCTHRSAQHPLLTVPRGLLWENSCLDSNRTFSGAIMSCQVHRAFELVSGCKQPHTTDTRREHYA